MVIPVLIRVAFITLLERKILGLSQLRKGPNKVRVGGILQPFADAVKLFLKEAVLTLHRNKFIFCLGPALAIALICLLISFLPIGPKRGLPYGGVLIIVIMRLGVYPLFLQGWSSNSKYSLLGAVRGVAQTISYEITLALRLFLYFLFTSKFSLITEKFFSSANLLILAPPFFLLLISCVAETNRTPFDFSEGESELVSGFNTEFGGGLFALIFIAEYGIIIFFCYFVSKITMRERSFLGAEGLIGQILVFWWIWFRRTFPRYRYDKLLNLAWKSLLPWCLSFLVIYFSFILF